MWKDSVINFSINGLKNTYRLRQSLLNKTYKISPYQIFTITEPKVREITATRIKDRTFQHSLCDNYVYHELSKHFIYDNCACLKGKGVDFALKRLKTHLHRYYRHYGCNGWVLKIDIHHFFPETNHLVIKRMLKKYIPDKDVLFRLYEIIDSFGDKGIGLGSQSSQLMELAILNDLDHYIKEQLHIKYYVRYMDDLILICQDKQHLKECKRLISLELGKLKYTVNDKTEIYKLSQGIKFLKWRFILTPTGKVVMKMNKRSIKKERRKLKKLNKLCEQGKLTIEDIDNNFNSWKANASRGQTKSIVYKMQKEVSEIKKGLR